MEKWKAIVGYEGFYEISNQGRVRSVDRVIEHPAKGPTRRKGKELSPATNWKGYLHINLCREGKMTPGIIHRLVLSAFVGPCPDGHECNHISGDKTDNRIQNLEWVTPSENRLHAYANGLTPAKRGESNGMAKLTWATVEEIRKLYASGAHSYRQLGDRFGVTKSAIHAVISGRTWLPEKRESHV